MAITVCESSSRSGRRIAEAGAALALRGVGGQLDELAAQSIVAIDQQARREEPREQKELLRLSAAANEALRAVAHDFHRRISQQRVDEAAEGSAANAPGLRGEFGVTTATS